MAVILEDIDSAPGCAYCRFRFQSGGITGLFNIEPSRCKINMKNIVQYCDMTQAPSKPDWCPVKGALHIGNGTYQIFASDLNKINIVEGEIIHDN